MTSARPGDARGRRRSTTPAAIEATALRLFASNGFDATTVEQIADAVGIGRRTFFRYFDSKNDVVWGDFDGGLCALRDWLAATPADQPLLGGITDAVVRFNQLPPDQEPAHRLRMALILRVPALQAHSALRYASWRRVVAEHAAGRLDRPVDSLEPQVVGHAALAAALAAYEQWLAHPGTDLSELLRTSFGLLDLRTS